MPKPPAQLKNPLHLRDDAEAHIRHGIAPPTRGWILSPGVLETLYKLASDPDRAPDGLKLLHELQIHQVELDLQLKQLESAEAEFAEELTHYQGLFEFAPVGYIVLGNDGQIVKSNVLAKRLLGMEREELDGPSAERFLAPESLSTFNSFLKRLPDTGSQASCTVQSNSNHDKRTLQLTATLMPGGDTILVVVTEFNSEPTSPSFANEVR